MRRNFLLRNSFNGLSGNKSKSALSSPLHHDIILPKGSLIPSVDRIVTNGETDFLRSYMENPVRILPPSATAGKTGLFRVPELSSIKGFPILSDRVITRCSELRKMTLEMDRKPAEVLELLDQISNTLCSLLDICEFLRHMHPDKSFVNAADETVQNVGAFMNLLNTDTELYKASAKFNNFKRTRIIWASLY